MSLGLIVSFTGVIVAGLAGVLGVWMERGPDSSTKWAMFFSAMIGLSMGVEMIHTGWQNAQDGVTDGKMATLLLNLSELSAHNPELEEFVAAELAVQQRTNPEMVQKLEKKVAEKGGDPKSIGKMAADGRKRRARAPAPTKPPPIAKADAPKKDKKADADKPKKADEKVGAAADEAAAKLAAANKDAAKAIAAADAKAKALMADANKQADAAKAKAAEAQKLADEKMKQATAKLDEATKLMDKATAALKNVPDVPGLPGGGGGKGGKGGKGKVPKIPGL